MLQTHRTPFKIFALNLSAPFICQFFKVQLEEVLPYTDILFGNESEAEAWGSASGVSDPKDPKAVAKALAQLKKTNPGKPRIVVITSGAESTVVAKSNEEEVKVYAVTPLPDNEIVDTNGAGDAFAGGFMGAYVAGKSIDECVEVGHKMGAICVGQVSSSARRLRAVLNLQLFPTDWSSAQVAESQASVSRRARSWNVMS